MIPPKVGAETSAAERRAHAALSNLTDDDWTVIHQVAWQGLRDGQQADGEADFVLLHPSKGVLILEIKGGGITVGPDGWRSRDAAGRTHSIKDPYEQAVESKHALLNYLHRRIPALPRVPAGHAAWFPDLTGIPDLGPDALPEITLAKSDLTDPDTAITKLGDHWELRGAGGLAGHMEGVVRVLAPTAQVRVLLKDEVAEANARIVTLTAEQMRVLDGLQRNRRVMVYGTAGSGKTVLAVEKARRLAADGHRVLLVCYNKPLAKHLHGELADTDTIDVRTFHSLVEWQGKKAGLPMPLSTERTQQWWEEQAPQLLIEAATENGYIIDAVVVDEGQDFLPSWFEVLDLLTGDPATATLYVFADPTQAIYRIDWEPPFVEPAFDIRINCRNTRPIASRVSAVFRQNVDARTGDGPDPQLIAVNNLEGAVAALRGVLHKVVNEGKLGASQVVILTDRSETRDALDGRKIAGLTLTTKEGGMGIHLSTVHRFKGLESDAVVLLLDEAAERTAVMAYIGMSRARTHLTVIAHESAVATINWAG